MSHPKTEVFAYNPGSIYSIIYTTLYDNRNVRHVFREYVIDYARRHICIRLRKALVRCIRDACRTNRTKNTIDYLSVCCTDVHLSCLCVPLHAFCTLHTYMLVRTKQTKGTPFEFNRLQFPKHAIVQFDLSTPPTLNAHKSNAKAQRKNET